MYYNKAYPTEAVQHGDSEAVFGMVERPNHGLANAVRKAAYVPHVADFFKMFYRGTDFVKSDFDFKSSVIFGMQLTMLFEVAGRESEVSYEKDPIAYGRYHNASCDAFQTYIEKHVPKKFLSTEERNMCVVAFRQMHMSPSDKPATAAAQRILEVCHDLDMSRCKSEKYMASKIKNLKIQIGTGPTTDLLCFVEECIRATGDRLIHSFCKTSTQDYQNPPFADCSMCYDACKKTVDACHCPTPEPEERFLAPTLQLGQVSDAAAGLEVLMGVKKEPYKKTYRRKLLDEVEAIESEFLHEGKCDPAQQELFRQVLNDEVGDGKTLDELLDHPDAQISNLEKHHVVALRLYTTELFSCINKPLREKRKPHPFAVTTTFLHEGIKQLMAAQGTRPDAKKQKTLWRGLKDLRMMSEFMLHGGTEFGCMSTTTSRKVAAEFAQSGQPLIFEIKTKDFMMRGADIQFLSVYEHEEEVLFPPLTYLRCLEMHKEREVEGVTAQVAVAEPVIPGL